MKKLLMITAGLALLQASPAHAEFQGWGPHVGVRQSPDQVFFGAHFDLGNISRNVRLQPNIDMGLGDDVTLLSLRLDGAYSFVSRWGSWTPYVGAGIGLHAVGSDEGLLEGDTHSDAGMSVLGGLEKGLSSGSRFFVEGRAGFIDAPEFEVRTGWTFHH